MGAKEERAERLAARMPLVNFPATTPLASWVPWGCLRSRAKVEGDADADADPTTFQELRRRHVFTYAGPCCYFHPTGFGDAAIYFQPGTEQGHAGSVTPFDSGALEDPGPHLQPWASLPEPERWSFFLAQQIQLPELRPRFTAWLAASYDDPDRYLETPADRCEAGQPDRLDPPELLEHNGTRGRERYAPSNEHWADRRAWTWEVRMRGDLTWDRIAALHVPPDMEEQAREQARAWADAYGVSPPAVKVMPMEIAAGRKGFYQDSGRVLRDLIDTP